MTFLSPGVAVGLEGFSGAGIGTWTSSEGRPSPAGLTARTWKVYSLLLARPVTLWVVVVAPLLEMVFQSV